MYDQLLVLLMYIMLIRSLSVVVYQGRAVSLETRYTLN